MSKKLAKLLKQCELNCPLSLDSDADVTLLTLDSRKVVQGSIFFAVPGMRQDGHQFLEQIKDQALLMIGSDAYNYPHYLRVSDPLALFARMSEEFYDNPSKLLRVVGVTGTSGKTTTTYILEKVLQLAGFKTGVIG